MEIVTTHTEAEALLLEANLIKRLKPRFNIILRDDKSYPWLMLTEDHPYPQIAKHRGAQARKGSYWGPFASAWAVNQTVTAMQRVFLLRSCADTVFSARTRPCLLFQIKRCSAPCVGRIEAAEYAKLVHQAKAFLAGNAGSVQQELAAEMERAAAALEFERAAAVRDRIRGLTFVQGNDVINPAGLSDADVIAAWQLAGPDLHPGVLHPRRTQQRQPRLLSRPPRGRGNRRSRSAPSSRSSTMTSRRRRCCWSITELPEHDLIAEALSLKASRKVEISLPQRGEKRAVVLHAEINAREALERKLAESPGQTKLLEGVEQLFKLPKTPCRIEVYDNSHIMGTNPYGVMIVSGPEGFLKSAYRKFGIRGPITPGDDFAMMREMLQRRFTRAQKEQADGAPLSEWPDLLLIDGGAGQLSRGP